MVSMCRGPRYSSKKDSCVSCFGRNYAQAEQAGIQSKGFCVKGELWRASESLTWGPNLVSEVKGFPKEVTFVLNPE